ncbi:cytochrome P450 [Dictyobacter alpinus]|uniref:Cytochrome P450 n=1 Tax=Dictyobacter alpinus TaxID=2014873 RepID=A0A402BKJ9_9CHLR|nr:cytochrome P450 [Dictyobacter alpinus]GCE31861.1 cytochrome P450 [Dictyobacter alpinus]
MTVDAVTDLLPSPPLAPGLPLLGSALAMRQDLVAFLVEQYRQLGPIFRVRALNQEMVVMAGPEANTFVTKEGTDKFSSYELWHKFGLEFGAEQHLSAIDGENHAQLRKLFKPAYSVSRLLADIPMLVDIAEAVLNRLPVGEEIPALYLFRMIVTEQLGRALANYAPGDNLQYMITSVRFALNVYVTKQMPNFMLKLPVYQRARQHYLKMGQDIVAEHRATTRTTKDLIDGILTASQDPAFQEMLSSEEQIAFASLGPFVAGLDTAANECSFMLYELLKHPSILEQCEAAADELFSQGLPTQEQIRGHGVLHSAMMETLRMHSISPVVNRIAAKDFAFAGHQIKKGQNVIIATTVSHFLPEFYPDPYTFDIERYSAERKEHKQRGAYAPFGIGTHLCLGAGAAEAQIVLVLATLLHSVRLERVDPQASLRVRNDPAPTFGYSFRVRLREHRH